MTDCGYRGDPSVLAHLKSWSHHAQLPTQGQDVWYATGGIAQMRNLAMVY